MTSNIIQTLLSTRAQHPIEDVDAWVDRLTTLGDEIAHSRQTSPQLLTRNEAEVLVRNYGKDESRSTIAEEMGISPNRVDNLRYAAEDDLLAAEQTLAIIGELREEIRPDPDADSP